MNEPDAKHPERLQPDEPASPSDGGAGDPAAIVARIQTAGDAVPATLREAVYGVDEKDPPSLVIESAEGVTTFGGLNGHPGTPKAKQWLEARLAAIAERYSIQTGASSTSARASPPTPRPKPTDP